MMHEEEIVFEGRFPDTSTHKNLTKGNNWKLRLTPFFLKFSFGGRQLFMNPFKDMEDEAYNFMSIVIERSSLSTFSLYNRNDGLWCLQLNDRMNILFTDEDKEKAKQINDQLEEWIRGYISFDDLDDSDFDIDGLI